MTSSLAAQPSYLGSDTFADADNVLHGLPHPSGAVVAFGDDTWDFRVVEGLTPNLQRSALVVEWKSVANPAFRLAAKEVLFAQLHPDHRRVTQLLGWRRPLAVRGIQMHLVLWRAWFAWLDDNDVDDLADVRAHHWDAYLHRRRQDGVSAHHVAVTVKRIRDFYDYAAILTSPTYPSRPWGRRTAWSVAGAKRRRENATPPIPDDVFGPLVGAALHLLEHADTIIAARDVHGDVVGPRTTTQDMAGGGALRPDDCDRRVRTLIDQHRAARCPLPLREARGPATFTDTHLGMIALWAGVSPKVLAAGHRRSMIVEAAAELGVAPTPLVRSFGEAHDHLLAFGQVISSGRISAAVDLLVTACYIVVALSGMRLEEITALRRGCIQRVRLRNGDERIRLHGTVYKHQRLGGTPASWVVIEEIQRAVTVLERLAPADQDLLFTPETMRAYRRRTPPQQTTVGVNHYLHRFCDWLAGGILPPGLQPIPAGTRVTTRQFRRTMARILAFRPHGVVAGKVHLKHLHIAMSEGYYGNANSSLAAFHADMEAELAAARLEAAKERYQAYLDGGGVAGGARKALNRHFEEIATAMASFPGTTLEADKHLEKLLADRLGKLHIGTVNDCWFIDPSKALCRKGETEPTEPRPNACVGDGCPNAAVSRVHLPVYRASHEQVVTLRRSRQVSDYEKERLAREQRRLEKVIDAVENRQ
jgi:hypothetical protein